MKSQAHEGGSPITQSLFISAVWGEAAVWGAISARVSVVAVVVLQMNRYQCGR
jgi:hypothetical protein